MPRGDAPVRSLTSPLRWPVFLTAMVGAWLGHFVEYVRVAGWHAGLADMTTSDHAYFMPAGAALVAAGVVAAIVMRRLWLSLGRRLRLAQIVLRQPPAKTSTAHRGAAPGRPDAVVGGAALGRLWAVLAVLQVAIWMAQENIEAVAGGQHAPMLGVVSGAHVLAPVVQAEIALILAGVYVVVHRRFQRRQSQVWALECLVARRWRRLLGPALTPPPTPGFADTPLERWGAQRWQRPPPVAA